MQMVSHKPRYRANCVDLLHSYLVNLAPQVNQPGVEARQALDTEPSLRAVWLSGAAVSVVQQVSFHHHALFRPGESINACMLGRVYRHPTSVITSSCKLTHPLPDGVPVSAAPTGMDGIMYLLLSACMLLLDWCAGQDCLCLTMHSD